MGGRKGVVETVSELCFSEAMSVFLEVLRLFVNARRTLNSTEPLECCKGRVAKSMLIESITLILI
jgi:hypothetical protein